MIKFKEFLDIWSTHGAMLFMLFMIAVMLVLKIKNLTLPAWNGFLDSLDRHGGHIFVGSFWTLCGIIMLKVMLFDDGKGVIGFGLGILSRSMGTHAATADEKEVATLLSKYKDSDPAIAAFLSKIEKPQTT